MSTDWVCAAFWMKQNPFMTITNLHFWALWLSLGLLGMTTKSQAGLLHERWDDTFEIPLVEGGPLKVRQSGSQRKYFGHPHLFGFGGGGLKQKLEFSRDGRAFVWEGGFTPILLQFDDKTPVLVIFDRESSERIQDWGLRYFRFDEKWIELPLKQFPRHLAMQNLWLTHHDGWVDGVEIDEYEIVKKCDPDNVHFQRSLMATLWLCIATGKSYDEAGTSEKTAEFLRGFKASMSK
jgi:hypothetical protein